MIETFSSQQATMVDIQASLNHILHSLIELSARINKPPHTPPVQPINIPTPLLSLPPPPNPAAPSSFSPSKPTLPSSYPIKHLTYSEMQQLRDQGLCLNCHDIDTPSHCCPIQRILLVMPDEDPTIEQQSMEILKLAVPKTLRFQGTFLNSQVATLIDIEQQPLKLLEPAVPEQLTKQEISLHGLISASYLKAMGVSTPFYGHQATTLITGNGKKIENKGYFSKDCILILLGLFELKTTMSESKVLVFDPGGTFKVERVSDLEGKVDFEGMVMIR